MNLTPALIRLGLVRRRVCDPDPADISDWSNEPGSDALMTRKVLERVIREARRHDRDDEREAEEGLR